MEFCMPKLDHLSEEALISEWLKKSGERVEKGEILLRVETGKAVLDVESDLTGVIKEILVEEGETVPVLTLIAIIDAT